jgi:hypothetical protein
VQKIPPFALLDSVEVYKKALELLVYKYFNEEAIEINIFFVKIV